MLKAKSKKENENADAVTVNKYDFVTSKDIDYVTGKKIPWTWDRFDEIWQEDVTRGNFDKSTEVAISLLAPVLMKKKQELLGTRACSDDDRDLYQDVYLAVCENIKKYNPNLGYSFNTFISKYLSGVTREIKTGGMSNNDIKNGYRIYSQQAMMEKDGEKNEAYELVDPKSEVDGIYFEHEEKRSRRALSRMISVSEESSKSSSNKVSHRESSASQKDQEEEDTRRYVAAAFFSKFMEGFDNMTEAMQDKLEAELEII